MCAFKKLWESVDGMSPSLCQCKALIFHRQKKYCCLNIQKKSLLNDRGVSLFQPILVATQKNLRWPHSGLLKKIDIRRWTWPQPVQLFPPPTPSQAKRAHLHVIVTPEWRIFCSCCEILKKSSKHKVKILSCNFCSNSLYCNHKTRLTPNTAPLLWWLLALLTSPSANY